jgi:hypothetical protein
MRRQKLMLGVASIALFFAPASVLADGVSTSLRARVVRLPPGGIGSIRLPESVYVSPELLRNAVTLALYGTRIQISQTDQGSPLSPSGAMSYIDFGPGTNEQGVQDRAFDVPVVQRPLGDLAMGAIGALSGGIFTAYEVRFKVNDLESEFDFQTFNTWLDGNVFGFDIAFSSGDPTVKCEANTLSMLPFGFPIPVGWHDDTCPDAQLTNTHVRIGFVPALDANGQVTIKDVSVELVADIDVSPVDFLDDYLQFKQKLKDGFASALRDKLMSDDFKHFFGTALQRVLEAKHGQPIAKLSSLQVDATGIYAELGQ